MVQSRFNGILWKLSIFMDIICLGVTRNIELVDFRTVDYGLPTRYLFLWSSNLKGPWPYVKRTLT